MNPILTTFGLIAGPLSLAFVFWCLLAEIGRVRDLTTEADIARIEEGFALAETPEPTPEPVEPEPFRRIAWEVDDEEIEAAIRAFRWATGELERIKARVYAEVAA